MKKHQLLIFLLFLCLPNLMNAQISETIVVVENPVTSTNSTTTTVTNQVDSRLYDSYRYPEGINNRDANSEAMRAEELKRIEKENAKKDKEKPAGNTKSSTKAQNRLFAEAVEAFKSKNLGYCISLCDKILAQNRQYAEAYFLKGACYYLTNNKDIALKYFEIAADMDCQEAKSLLFKLNK